MSSSTIPNDLHAAILNLRGGFSGQVLDTGHADYEGARKIHNGLVDKRPVCIAQCANAEDVKRAIATARRLNLDISVRGGGHNVAGRAVCEGGLMIDCSPMKSITVDPKARTVTAGAGTTWGELNAATLKYSLATTGGVISSTGVAGLTLGGGLGWLMSMYGMTVDNLYSAQVVTADGEILTASDHENADLFWGIRGGGGNFGVVTSFTLRLHRVNDGVGGLVAHPIDRAAPMLQFFRETTATAPDELSVFGGLVHAPDGSGNKLGVMISYHPDPASGTKLIQPIKEFGPPIMDATGPMPYAQLNTMLDGGFPRGALNYWKSSFLARLPDDAIDIMVNQFRTCPAPLGAMLLEHFHGAVTRVPVSATAYAQRRTGYNFLIIGQWMDPNQTPECMSWVRRTYELMSPYMHEGKYVNYLGDDAAQDAVAQAYGPNYERLRQLKRKYDPENVFKLNQNIRPA